MGEVRPIPTLGGVFRDLRGQGRTLRVSWHAEDGLVVLSLWDGPRCTGTVRIASADVPDLLEALAAGYQRPGDEPPTPPPLPPTLAPAPESGQAPPRSAPPTPEADGPD